MDVKDKVSLAVEALEFYADLNRYEGVSLGVAPINDDRGNAARAALALISVRQDAGGEWQDDVIKIRIEDIKKGIAHARLALSNNELRLIDIWILTLADQIKSLEHAYLNRTQPAASQGDGELEKLIHEAKLHERCECFSDSNQGLNASIIFSDLIRELDRSKNG